MLDGPTWPAAVSSGLRERVAAVPRAEAISKHPCTVHASGRAQPRSIASGRAAIKQQSEQTRCAPE
jgi:hypothetical protein